MSSNLGRNSGLAWRPFSQMSRNATYIDYKTGQVVSPQETSEVLVDARTGQMVDPDQLFIDNTGNLGRTNTRNQNVVLPYKYKYKLMPYHDTMRMYRVPVYNTEKGEQVSPEDAKRFGIDYTPKLIGEDNWKDPSENMLNTGLALGIAFPTFTSSLLAGELGGYGFNTLYKATHNGNTMEQDGVSSIYNLGYWFGGDAGYKGYKYLANNANKVYPWMLRTFGSKGSRLGHTMDQYTNKLLSETIGANRPPYYFQNGQWNTSQMSSDISQGKSDFINEILSPEYSKVAAKNVDEASSLGLHYTPTFEKSSFKSILDDGIDVKLNWSYTNHDGDASTSFFGAQLGQKTPVEYWGYSPTSFRQTTAHEVSHAARHGMPSTDVGIDIAKKEAEYLKHKSSEVFVDNFEVGPYVLTGKGSQTGEAYANCRDLGKELGIQFNQPYPGDKKVLEILNSNEAKNSTKNGLIEGFRKDNLRAVWKALNGTQWILIPTLIYQYGNNKQK